MPVRVKSEPKQPEEGDAMQIDHDVHVGQHADDDDDEIVREMDVYLSPQLAQQLHLLQFPLQHPQTSFTLHPQSARIKPRHNLLELDQAIPTNIERQGEQQMLQRTYASNTVPVTTHLTLGKILPTAENDQKMALHLVPLKHITQMRPTFTHIDDEDERNNPENSTVEEEKAAMAQKEKEKKPLMFQKKESERAAMARKNSYAYKKASEEGEEWTHLQVLDHDDDDESPQLEALMQQLECPVSCRNQSVLDVKMSASAADAMPPPSLFSYVRSLDYLPTTSTTKTTTNNTSATTNTNTNMTQEDDEDEDPFPFLDMQQLAMDYNNNNNNNNIPLDLPTIGAHLTRLLCRGWPIPYSILRKSLPPSVPDKDILDALSSCAVMVRGNFILQSRLMGYPRPLAKARTFVLLLLQSMGTIHRNRLEQVYGLYHRQTKGSSADNSIDNNNNNNNNNAETYYEAHVNSETLVMILNQVSRKTPDGWALKVEDDMEFPSKFPQNTALHMQYWGRQMLRFREYLERYAATN